MFHAWNYGVGNGAYFLGWQNRKRSELKENLPFTTTDDMLAS
jgi:hypothetical protein